MSEEGAAKAEEQRQNENAFLLTWLGLGIVILIEGIILAASGIESGHLHKTWFGLLTVVSDMDQIA